MIKSLWFTDRNAWVEGLSKDFQALVDAAISARGVAHVALSGGSTPKPLYAWMNQTALPWDKIDWWLGDERWVPPTDAQSNEKMIRETLGLNQSVFDAHFHSWHLSKDPAEAASLYETELKSCLGEPPSFDLILLGLGLDGHIASLFPWSKALDEKMALAVKNEVVTMNSTRLTFTYPLLNQAREIWFLVEGMDKEERATQLIGRDISIPAARIMAPNQKLYWQR